MQEVGRHLRAMWLGWTVAVGRCCQCSVLGTVCSCRTCWWAVGEAWNEGKEGRWLSVSECLVLWSLIREGWEEQGVEAALRDTSLFEPYWVSAWLQARKAGCSDVKQQLATQTQGLRRNGAGGGGSGAISLLQLVKGCRRFLRQTNFTSVASCTEQLWASVGINKLLPVILLAYCLIVFKPIPVFLIDVLWTN